MDARFITRAARLALIGVACAVATGCSGVRSKPECPVPDGPRCLSTIEAYERTHGDTPALEGLVPYDGREAVRGGAEAPQHQPRRAVMPAAPVAQDGTLVLASMTGESMYPASMTAPQVVATESAYRVPATVMRVWINAWEDEEGGLHLPQKVFREVEARRWSVGDKAPGSSTTYQLLESVARPAKESQTVAPQGARAGS